MNIEQLTEEGLKCRKSFFVLSRKYSLSEMKKMLNIVIFSGCDKMYFYGPDETSWESTYDELICDSNIERDLATISILQDAFDDWEEKMSQPMNARILTIEEIEELVKEGQISQEDLKRILYSCVTEEDFICIENGSLGILPDAYDRLGVPIPNWECKEYKMKWHHKLDLVKKYKLEK